MFFHPKRFISAGTVSFRYFSCIRLIMPFSFLPKSARLRRRPLQNLTQERAGRARPLQLFIERGAAPLARAHSAAVGQGVVADAGVLSAISANHLDVGSVHRAFFFDDATLDVLRRVRPGMPLDNVGMLDDDRVLPRIDRKHAAAFAGIAAAQYADVIALANADGVALCAFVYACHDLPDLRCE